MRFFNPRRSKKRDVIRQLAHQIVEQRYRVDQQPVAIQLKSNARQFIMAERLYQDAIIALNGDMKALQKESQDYRIPTGIPIEISGKSTNYGPTETYTIGDSDSITLRHRNDPKRVRIGDMRLDNVGKYSDGIPNTLALAGQQFKTPDGVPKKQNQSTARSILKLSSKHRPMATEQLHSQNKELRDAFNRCAFLCAMLEQKQWHPELVTPQFKLGMMVAQARCMLLLRASEISILEAIQSKNTQYTNSWGQYEKESELAGVYSGSNLINCPTRMQTPCENIETRYSDYTQKKFPDACQGLFAKDSNTHVILTRKQAHADLQTMYGGESDTDGGGYDTEIDFISDTEDEVDTRSALENDGGESSNSNTSAPPSGTDDSEKSIASASP